MELKLKVPSILEQHSVYLTSTFCPASLDLSASELQVWPVLAACWMPLEKVPPAGGGSAPWLWVLRRAAGVAGAGAGCFWLWVPRMAAGVAGGLAPKAFDFECREWLQELRGLAPKAFDFECCRVVQELRAPAPKVFGCRAVQELQARAPKVFGCGAVQELRAPAPKVSGCGGRCRSCGLRHRRFLAAGRCRSCGLRHRWFWTLSAAGRCRSCGGWRRRLLTLSAAGWCRSCGLRHRRFWLQGGAGVAGSGTEGFWAAGRCRSCGLRHRRFLAAGRCRSCGLWHRRSLRLIAVQWSPRSLRRGRTMWSKAQQGFGAQHVASVGLAFWEQLCHVDQSLPESSVLRPEFSSANQLESSVSQNSPLPDLAPSWRSCQSCPPSQLFHPLHTCHIGSSWLCQEPVFDGDTSMTVVFASVFELSQLFQLSHPAGYPSSPSWCTLCQPCPLVAAASAVFIFFGAGSLWAISRFLLCRLPRPLVAFATTTQTTMRWYSSAACQEIWLVVHTGKCWGGKSQKQRFFNLKSIRNGFIERATNVKPFGHARLSSTTACAAERVFSNTWTMASLFSASSMSSILLASNHRRRSPASIHPIVKESTQTAFLHDNPQLLFEHLDLLTSLWTQMPTISRLESPFSTVGKFAVFASDARLRKIKLNNNFMQLMAFPPLIVTWKAKKPAINAHTSFFPFLPFSPWFSCKSGWIDWSGSGKNLEVAFFNADSIVEKHTEKDEKKWIHGKKGRTKGCFFP